MTNLLAARQALLIQRLDETGRLDITIMDEGGRYDRISVSIR